MFDDYEKLPKDMFNSDVIIPDYEHKNRKNTMMNLLNLTLFSVDANVSKLIQFLLF